MKILVINSGSSSIKYQLLNMDNDTVLASGVIECIGLEQGILTHKKLPDSSEAMKIVVEQPIPDHAVGMHLAVDALTHPVHGVIKDASEIDGVGHRIVHGGEKFTTPLIVDKTVTDGILEVAPLAPLHNYAHLTGIEVAQSFFKCPHVTVFDTAFHQTMPAEAYQYAIPYEIYEELHVRRYGFHGTSHKYVSKRTAEILGKPAEDLNMITVHLGNGSSLSAVRGGKCVDTSMGLTPLAGVIMGTRCGDIDPAIMKFVAEKKGMTVQQIDEMLTKRSGLHGICGMSDMRDIHAAAEKGDERAKLANDMLCHTVRRFIGAYWAELGHVDAIVFTAGIGENDDVVRAGSLKGMEPMGVVLDAEANSKRAGEWMRISAPESKVDVLVVRTNEELEIARETLKLIS